MASSVSLALYTLITVIYHYVCPDDSHDVGSDEPGSPTVLLDKKTRRRFLDLGLVHGFSAVSLVEINTSVFRIESGERLLFPLDSFLH